jgi:alkylation response protein AidB-like acyl-CoA dehydrogenase
MFIQTAPRCPDLYEADAPLRVELKRRLPPAVFAKVESEFQALGADTAGRLTELSDAAEAQPPTLQSHDPWGRRVDRIHTAPAWTELKDYAATHGIVATGYRDDLGPHHRVVQAGLLHLYSASSAIFSCPLAMTDAAARVLLDSAEPALRDDLLPKLLSRDPQTFITSGQWMTERTGGSDVGRSETIARPVADGTYTLHGAKWFTSATTSEMALTLARIDDGVTPPVPGSRGLSLFCVRVRRDEHHALQGIRVDRLKDKLGTKALPTAELTLDGLRAERIGPVGRGVATIATMLNVTRFYNAVSSCSGMSRALYMARDYAQRRVAFGKVLADHPLHARTLDGLEVELHGALSMAMEVASLLGRMENGVATTEELRVLRGLIPLAKLTLGKQAVAVASEALECFGGAGYIEDTGLPRLLRDAQVLSIWEGTTNVLSLDLLRAEGSKGSFSAVLADLTRRSALLDETLPESVRGAISQALGRVSDRATSLVQAGDRLGLEANARDLALTTGYCAQAVFLGEAAAVDAPTRARFERFTRTRLMAPLA